MHFLQAALNGALLSRKPEWRVKAAYKSWSGVNPPIHMLGMCVECFLE